MNTTPSTHTSSLLFYCKSNSPSQMKVRNQK